MALEPLGLTDPECRQSVTLKGSKTGYCYWSFEFRAPQSVAAFNAVVDAMPGCLEGAAAGPQDQGVNHPNSYDLRRFRDASGQVSVSIKDKGELQKTFVFLRVDAPPQQ
jgi:hypothetical protein